MFHLLLAALVALAQTASPTPVPSATPAATTAPSPTPSPPFSVGGDFTVYALDTQGTWDADSSNVLLNLNANAGKLHGNVTVGEYAFPTVGFPFTSSGASTSLYSVVPAGSVQYTFDSHWSVAAGKFAALLGQESPFTFQNLNIQRGLGWAMEPTISRGVQATYASGPWTLTAQYNDAYYSGSNRAFEGLIGWAPSADTNLQFAFIVPSANAGPNPTTSVGNKAEYDLMYTRQIGKLQILPYFLYVDSPASAALGYKQSENAWAGVLLATWAFNTPWSVAFRYENAGNGSAAGDTGANADLIGFGPGSSARSYTITPALHFPNSSGVLRLEYSNVNGTGVSQDRIGLEFGVMH